MIENTLDISLHAILDPQIARGRPLPDLARAAVAGGATILQLRAKTATTREMIAQAQAIRAALAGSGVPFLVNDRVDVALAVGADGAHLGQSDMPFQIARRLLGPRAIIGATINTAEDVAALPIETVDYACVGAAYATSHKPDATTALGPAGVGALRAALRRRAPALPVGAIAGIDADNLGALIRVGCDGVAAIGAAFAQDDVEGAVRRLAAAIRAARA